MVIWSLVFAICCCWIVESKMELSVYGPKSLYGDRMERNENLFNRDGIVQLVLSTLGLPTWESVNAKNGLGVNLMEKTNFYVLGYLETDNVKEMSDFLKSKGFDSFSVQESTLNLVEAVNSVVESEMNAKFGKASLNCVNEGCAGNNMERFTGTEGIVTAMQDKYAGISKSDASQVSNFNAFVENMKHAKRNAPSVHVFTLANGRSKGMKNAMEHAVEKVLEQMRQDGVFHVIVTSTGFNTYGSNIMNARRLQEGNGTTAGNGTTTGNETVLIDDGKLTMSDIAGFQIALWTSIMLATILLIAACCMCNMPIGKDSLLYAKFQADTTTHRKVN